MPAKKKVTPDEDLRAYNEFTYRDEVYQVKRKFKVGRFLKTLNTAPIDALEYALEEDSYERFLDLEMDMGDLEEFLEILSNVMAGEKLKN